MFRSLRKVGYCAAAAAVFIFLPGCISGKTDGVNLDSVEISDTMQVAGEITPDSDGTIRFTWETEDLNIELFVEDSEQPAVVVINDVQYPFSYGYGYSPMESEAPLIIRSKSVTFVESAARR